MLRCIALAAFTAVVPLSAQTIETVGGTGASATGTARAKANSYSVEIDTFLLETEVFLDFTGPQTMTFFVYHSPVEFGTYTLQGSIDVPLTGAGQAWYSSGPIAEQLDCGNHYIIGASWPGTATYYFDVANSLPMSFGEYTHGYAVGFHPLPPSFSSTTNDQAAYHQRLTTVSTAILASYTTSGTGCTGSGGIPTLVAGSTPQFGQTLTVNVTNLPAAATSTSMILGFSQPPGPLDLSIIGMTGCVLNTDVLITTPIPAAGGSAVYSIAIPNDCAEWSGIPFSNEAITLDLAANPLGVTLSNVGHGLIGV